MLFWNKICCFTAIFFLAAHFCTGQALSYVKFHVKQQPAQPAFTIIKADSTRSNTLSIPLIPQNYYTQHFGIMCRKELAFEKATKIPLRFRLGSLAQCNYLEGKK